MSAGENSQVVYAQSSDIKARTYLQYRADMKKKAIAELEIREWLEGMLKAKHDTGDVKVEKSGGDRYMWFPRSGKISGEPDYTAWINSEKHRFEFQYAERDDLPYYDFKVSKVGRKKSGGTRIPHTDREFLYVIKPLSAFAVFSPQWVMDNGKEGPVPAWGSRPAFRVPAEKFKAIFARDKKLGGVIQAVDQKNRLLEAQSRFLEGEGNKISGELQQVVDEEKAFTIIPKNLDGFYRACLLMDKIGKYPKNYSMWMVYGESMYSEELNSYEFAKLVYSLDFLYGGATMLESNVLSRLSDAMRKFSAHIKHMQNQKLQTSQTLSPKEEAVNFLFAVNLYEDMVQELIFLHKVNDLPPIKKIFQSVEDMDFLCGMI